MIKPLFYLTLDPEKALGIEDLWPGYHIIYASPSQLSVPISYNGVNIVNITKPPYFKEFLTSHMLKVDKLQKYIKDLSIENEKPNIIVFKSDESIEQIVDSLGYRLLNPFSKLLKVFENKIKITEFLKNLNILQPDFLIFDKFQDVDYKNIQFNLGDSFVIQFPYGHSGSSTFFIKNEDDFNLIKIKYPQRIVKISKLIDGPTYTVNACASKLGTIIAGISEQITGIKELTPTRGGTVGNDFSQRHLNDNLRIDIIKLTQIIGDYIYQQGFRGMFGIDFVIDLNNKKIYTIELNLRQIASSSFSSYIQRLNKIVPIFLWHILELLEHNYAENIYLLNEFDETWINNEIKNFIDTKNKIDYFLSKNQPIKASQVFLRNINNYPIQIIEQFPTGAFRIRGRVPQDSLKYEEQDKEYISTYPMREDGWSTLCLEKRAYNIMEMKENEDFLILTKPEKSVIEPLEEIGRIQILDTVFGNDFDNLPHGWIFDVFNTVFENMTYVKYNNSENGNKF